jgi:peptidoglycan/xylan/chitin deacetylase (PgdA/CDA1 family)
VDGFPAGGGRLMGWRGWVRGAAVRSAAALCLDELLLASLQRTGGLLHAVNFHGTPAARREALVRQLEWLRSRFTVVDPLTPGALWENPASSGNPAALLTFDDGLESNFLVAAPVLESLGLRGLFFVNPGFAELHGPPARDFYVERHANTGDRLLLPESWTPMTRAQMAELARRGHAIGNHTYSHANLALSPREQLAHEIVDSRHVLSQWSGQAVESFAYTYAWNAISREAWDLARAYHRYCFAPCAGLTSRAAGPPGLIWRTHVECGYSEPEYRFMYSGLAALPAWLKRRRLKDDLGPAGAPRDEAKERGAWLLC